MSFAAPSIEAISASTHASFSRTAAGPLRREEIKGFPPPDIAVGDFNTARGSAAVAGVLPGLASAHAQGGIGPDYGWPRFVRSNNVDRATIPFIGVDQAFVRRERWRATAYRMIDMGVGTHRAQEVILTTADR